MGLYDRDYMNNSERDGYSESPRNDFSPIWILAGINFMLYVLFRGTSGSMLTLQCDENFRILQLVTAGFMHFDFLHLFFNMYGLYIFGKLVIPHMSSGKFYLLYFVGMITGNLIFLACYFHSHTALLGASGAVCAVMMAAALLEPNRKFFLLFFPIMPLKTSTLVIGYTVLEIVLQLRGTQSGIAHLAHLGGFAGGYLLLKLTMSKALVWDPLRWKPDFHSYKFSGEKPISFDNSTPVSTDELDYLLDKISRGGVNSLTPEEYQRLKQAREEMRK